MWNTRSPSRRKQLVPGSSAEPNAGPSTGRKLYSGGVTASSRVTWKSWLNVLPWDDHHGNVQPLRALYGSILVSGARDT